jgi:hypothetical protein
MKGKRIRKEGRTGVREGVGTRVKEKEEENMRGQRKKIQRSGELIVEEQKKGNSRKKRMINLEERTRVRKTNSKSVGHGAEERNI